MHGVREELGDEESSIMNISVSPAIIEQWPDLVHPAWHVWCNEMMSIKD